MPLWHTILKQNKLGYILLNTYQLLSVIPDNKEECPWMAGRINKKPKQEVTFVHSGYNQLQILNSQDFNEVILNEKLEKYKPHTTVDAILKYVNKEIKKLVIF